MGIENRNAESLEWVEMLNESDFPDLYARIARKVGKRNAVIIGLEFQGTVLQFPKLDKPLAIIRNKKIKEEYARGATYRELAVKYCLTERWVRKIIEEDPIESNQISLFDET